jgi:hypothetical protein
MSSAPKRRNVSEARTDSCNRHSGRSSSPYAQAQKNRPSKDYLQQKHFYFLMHRFAAASADAEAYALSLATSCWKKVTARYLLS